MPSMQCQGPSVISSMAAPAESRHAWGMEPADIKRLLEKSGKTQADLARALGLDPASVNRMLKGAREVKAREAIAIKSYLDGAEQVTMKNDTNVSEPIQSANIDRFHKVNGVAILGSALGGREDEFVISDEQIGFAKRLPGAMGKAKVYCLYVQGDSMSPWRESGQLIYVDPDRPAAIGDYVVVQLKQARDGDPRVAFVKRLIGRSGSKIRLLQWNPRKEIDITSDKIHQVHRVMPWEELAEL